ncbi:MAG: hypothetical protein VB062_07190 [Christensenella sp.]|nr:hypothetical protein [Christensenella sp.]
MKRKSILFPFAFVIALFAAALLTCPVHFLLNDDYALMQIVASWRSGTPEWFNVHNNVLYSAPISFLYRLWGNIPWYPIIQIAILLLSCLAILRSMQKAVQEKQGKIVMILSFVFLFVSGILPNLIFLQYSIVAAISGTAACILLVHREPGVWGSIKIALFACLSVLIRRETGAVTISMLFAAWVITFFEKSADEGFLRTFKMNFKRTFLPVCLTAVLCLGGIMLQEGVENTPKLKEFMQYNYLRVSYMDYQNYPTYQESDVYRRIGWSEPFYEMTKDWFFMDERFTSDSLSAILAEGRMPALSERLPQIIPTFLATLQISNPVRDLFLLFVGLTGATLLIHLIKRDFLGALRGCIPAACFFAASFYLCYRGRFPQHAFYTCILPACALLFYEWSRLKREGVLVWTITIVALAAMLGLSFNSAEHVFALSRSEVCQRQEKLSDEVDEYAVEHSQDIIITDSSIQSIGSPWQTNKNVHPLNRFFWGGWYYHSPFYYEQLKMNGRGGLYSSDFYDEHIQLLNNSPEMLDQLLAYLTDTYGETIAIPVSQEADFTAYRFELVAATNP